MADDFAGYSEGLSAPADNFLEITPHDTNTLATIPRAVFVGGAGDVEAKGSDGVAATFTVAAGSVLPIRPTIIMATGTTATGLVGLS